MGLTLYSLGEYCEAGTHFDICLHATCCNNRGHILLAISKIRSLWWICGMYICHRYGLPIQSCILSTFYSSIAGCGLATLEVAANSYISVLGSPKYAAARLNFSQGFQGVASFSGPLIASHYFFKGKNAESLDTVQWQGSRYAEDEPRLKLLFSFPQGIPRCRGTRCCPQYIVLVSNNAVVISGLGVEEPSLQLFRSARNIRRCTVTRDGKQRFERRHRTILQTVSHHVWFRCADVLCVSIHVCVLCTDPFKIFTEVHKSLWHPSS